MEAMVDSSFLRNSSVRDVFSSTKGLNSTLLYGQFVKSHSAIYSTSKPMMSTLKASLVGIAPYPRHLGTETVSFASARYKPAWPVIWIDNYGGFTYNLCRVYINKQSPKRQKQRQRTSRTFSVISDNQLQSSMDTIVIFDFDSTIIDVDSDPWVAKQLGLMHVMDELINTQMPWNDMMEVFLGEVYHQGKTVADVEDALRSTPLEPSKISAVQKAHGLGCHH